MIRKVVTGKLASAYGLLNSFQKLRDGVCKEIIKLLGNSGLISNCMSLLGVDRFWSR